MVITLSRQAESGGDEIARLIAERSGLALADRNILERIAHRAGVPVAHLTVFDEAMPGVIEAMVAEWRTSMSHGLYLRRLVQALVALERQGNALIMGRGAAFVLTDLGTLHVRVVSPMPCRVANLMERRGIYHVEAERLLRAADEARARFVRQSFDADIDAPDHYDLVLNTAELGTEAGAEIILLAAQRKALSRTTQEPPRDFISHMARFQRRPHLPRVSETTWRRCRQQGAG